MSYAHALILESLACLEGRSWDIDHSYVDEQGDPPTVGRKKRRGREVVRKSGWMRVSQSQSRVLELSSG